MWQVFFQTKECKTSHIQDNVDWAMCCTGQLVFSFLIKHLDNNVDVGVSVQHHPHLLLDSSHRHPRSGHL